jgi:hypothetical protein
MNNQSSFSPQGLFHDLQALVAEAETMLAKSVTGQPNAAINAMRTRLVAARDRFAIAYAGPRQAVMAGSHSAMKENR